MFWFAFYCLIGVVSSLLLAYNNRKKTVEFIFWNGSLPLWRKALASLALLAMILLWPLWGFIVLITPTNEAY